MQAHRCLWGYEIQGAHVVLEKLNNKTPLATQVLALSKTSVLQGGREHARARKALPGGHSHLHLCSTKLSPHSSKFFARSTLKPHASSY